MEVNRINYLIEQYIARSLTEAESNELLHLLSLQHSDETLNVLEKMFESEAAVPSIIGQQQTMEMFQRIMNVDKSTSTQTNTVQGADVSPKPKIYRINSFRKWLSAAAVVLLAFAGSYVWFAKKTAADIHEPTARATDIAPGKHGAILTLADGRQVVLDSMGNQLVADENGVTVVLENGRLAYNVKGLDSLETQYNTMSTPKGRQFVVVLSDGTKVWLNSASSLRYPTVFTGSERRVQITGEAYFEVAKDADKPFRIAVNGKAEIEVLGTHFNVNGYTNEETIKTTLLEGSVKMTPATNVASLNDKQYSVVLKPGQQAQFNQNKVISQHPISVLNEVDLSGVMAWKDGLFNFEGMRLKEVMKQLERWYDIEVIYEGAVSDIEFYGELSRNNSLGAILEAFKDAELKFRLEGRKLVILE